MTQKTREDLDTILKNVDDMKRNNAPTYWASLVGISVVPMLLILALLRDFGVRLLLVAAGVYIANHYFNKLNQERIARKRPPQPETDSPPAAIKIPDIYTPKVRPRKPRNLERI